ncbi:hypothetical protein [Pseudomonas folii]|uniref:Uncharacterized protein n=1 Tax=Pseudomonas folii TaxID=2762593 RepID=A0ABR7B1H9_9PSED|nr:hypothetical protein [Pseudomonas folii]MBC3951041.1 hypothetical protein [Pseudomonas folii]
MGETTSAGPEEPSLGAKDDLFIEALPIMEWKIKAHSHWIFPVDAGLGSLTTGAMCLYLWIIFFMEDSSTRDFFKVTTAIAPIQMGFYWWIARKKTVWNYKISTKGGHVEYWEDYFQYSRCVFVGLAIIAIVCVLAMVSIAPGMIWAIAGVGGMVILAAIKLLAWENEVESECFTWDRPRRIFVDRKRNLVVLERRYNPDVVGDNYLCVQVFLPKGRLDEFLAICKQYVSIDVKYEEGRFRE